MSEVEQLQKELETERHIVALYQQWTDELLSKLGQGRVA